MLHAYRLVYPFSQHGSPQLWEYEQPFIHNIPLKRPHLKPFYGAMVFC